MRSVLFCLLILGGCQEYDIISRVDMPSKLDDAVQDPSDGLGTNGPVCDPPDLAPRSTAIDESCGEALPLEAVLEWSDPGVGSTLSAPIVGSLTDDDGDGVIGPLDTPDIVIENWEHDLVVFSGDGSGEHWRVAMDGWGSTVPALGDIDSDGVPEIVTAQRIDGSTMIQARDGSTGVVEWERKIHDLGCLHSTLGIYDLDGDGAAEVVFGNHILEGATGRIRGIGDHGVGSSSLYNVSSVAADIDRDGELEVVVGNALYDADGNTIWANGEEDGWVAVANFDSDPKGEIVVVDRWNSGVVRMQDDDGTVEWTVNLATADLGRPTVADYDGDGRAEIAVASKYYLYVLKSDGSTLWRAPIDDSSSGFTGSSAFDFNGDGAAEVVYADQHNLWVFDGPTGAALLELGPHSSSTGAEFPVVADVDLDGHAEIILFSNDHPEYGTETGVKVFGSKWNDWPNTRPLWNQADYWVSNIDDSLGVPAAPAANWDTWNTFRANPATPYPVPDLDAVALPVDVCEVECAAGRLRLVVRVGNGGAGPLPPGVPVSVQARSGDSWVTVAETQTLTTIDVGESSEGLVVQLKVADVPEGLLRVVIDGAVEPTVDECDRDNNVVELTEVCVEPS